MIRLVVFDIAGMTVEDPDGVGGALKGAPTAAGIPWTHEAVNAIMGIPKPLAIRELLMQFETVGTEPAAARIDSIFRDFQKRMIAYYETDPRVKEIDGASEVFAELRSKGIKVVLDTGFDRSIVDALLNRLGWSEGVLDGTVASDEVARGRPHSDLIFAAMKLTEVGDIRQVAKVGDTPSDLEEGTAAGCALVIGVTEGTHTEDQLRPFPHTHLVPNVRDVLPLVVG